jgi:hypothetical protein
MRTRFALPPFSTGNTAMRRRFKQTESLQDRLTLFAREARDKATQLPPGIERDEMLKKAQQADTAAHLNDWINSPGLQPPE